MPRPTVPPGPQADRPANPARRRMLARIGLAGTLAYVAPALTVMGQARASGASGGGGSSGPSGGSSSGPSGPGSSGGGGSGPSMPAQRPRRADPQPQREPARPRRADPPEIVVLVPGPLDEAALLAAGYRVLSRRDSGALAGTVARLGLPPGRSPVEARADLAARLPGVVADENHLYRPEEFLCPDGACAAQALIGWSGWPSAFAPRIGMIDTGINTAHSALAGQRLTVFQTDLGSRPAAGRQHGTAIAALLVGRIDDRVPGLLPMAELIAIEAFHRNATGEVADAFSLTEAMDRLIAAQVDVINLSFAGPENALLERITAQAAAQGIGLVAAAGNGGPGAPPAFPAAWPHVVAVTAVDARLNPYRQAARGPHVALAAPGVGLWTAASISGGRLRSGTSYAAPFVTAALAVERMRNRHLPLSDSVARLLSCAQDLGDPGRDPVFGAGLLSAPGQCAAEDGIFTVSGE